MNIPSTIASPKALVQAFFDAHPSVDVIRLIACDYSNLIRGCLWTKERFIEAAEDPEGNDLDFHMGSLVYYLPQGKIHYDIWRRGTEPRTPDWESIRLFSAEPHHAIVYSNVKDPASDHPDVDGNAHGAEGKVKSNDPRIILRRIEQEAADIDIHFRVGIEIEFTLMESVDSEQAFKTVGGYETTTAFRHPTYPVILDIRRHLTKSGVRIWSTEKELGHGQWEISTCPESPVRAGDDYIMSRETICTVAWKHGMHATMHSSAVVGASATGLHCHISLDVDEETADHFLAAIMDHAMGLTAFTLGGFDSYQDRDWMIGGGWITWGEGKMAIVKRVGPTHFEVRVPDAHTNMHLQLAAILGTGLKGIKEKTELTVRPLPRAKPREVLSDEEREKLGIKHKIKHTLEERLNCLEEDRDWFHQVLGERLVEDYLTLRRKEIEAFTPMDPKVRRRIQIVNI